jgi:hypothetical protein
MKTITLLLFVCFKTYSQGFMNLNFESANVSAYSPGDSFVPTNNAIPGWVASGFRTGVGNLTTSVIWYDAISLGGPIISINDTNTGFSFTPLAGRYSVYPSASPVWCLLTRNQFGSGFAVLWQPTGSRLRLTGSKSA